jgi:hypothetical protein
MRAAGYEPEDFEDEVFDYWPEHEPAILLFAAVQTQWRVGFGGPTGFDYTAVFATMERMFRAESEEVRDEIFASLQVMERAALTVFSRKDK